MKWFKKKKKVSVQEELLNPKVRVGLIRQFTVAK